MRQLNDSAARLIGTFFSVEKSFRWHQEGDFTEVGVSKKEFFLCLCVTKWGGVRLLYVKRNKEN